MKKVLLSLGAAALLASSASALSIKADSAQAHFVGHKMAKKIGVPGVIDGAQFTFATTEGSAVDILKGASAEMDFANENTKDKTREKNIHRTLIAALSDSKISAKITAASGDDTAGDATALIKFNGVEQEVAMKYTVDGGKLKVAGVVDMSKDFNLAAGYEAMSTDKMISALHGKKTWAEVDIFFDVDAE